ncbi:MAG: tetratricopeptide repeat protein [Chloroflexi bacterium]|nr:tetratricopeptide repeat protein [Chloroflexota bacterium]
MQTRLSVFCEKILETGWLAAIIVAPLYFNVYSSRVFEPDKASLVRSLALLMVAAWLVKQIESGLPKTSLAETLRSILRNNPLIVPTFAVVVVYLISTILSVAPNVTLWGSYQRLEGTYTTFSYIVIFLMAVSTLRTRTQLGRAINTAIITSFPISFYGILQHYQLDPLPWGGDTTVRVAANMGNSIFVAAYLIMVVPLAAARLIETVTRVTQKDSRVTVTGLIVLAWLIILGLWIFNFNIATAFVILFFVVLVGIGLYKSNLRHMLLLATYTIILAAQFVAIYFTQSRGPWLGLLGAMVAFGIIYPLARGVRWLSLASIGLTIFGAVFLILFNLPSTPLDPLKQLPYIGRLGTILDTESGTNKVRELIWQGAVQLVLPHEPLWSPLTGDDAVNAIRPLVGYGPEAMYVAYNPFYPPDLAHYESRNASPDRAHNETFDALVGTGLLGFGAYILLFISIFYYALKLLGLIRTNTERNLFIVLWLAGGFFAAIAFGLWRGWNFIGVALPAGMILGLFIYLIWHVLRDRTPQSEDSSESQGTNALWLSVLIAAFIAHFIEIHFGIAIVSTRTYFWFYAALLVVIGMNKIGEPAKVAVAAAPRPVVEEATPKPVQRRRQRRRLQEGTRVVSNPNEQASATPTLAWTAIASLVIMTMTFEFVTNQAGSTSSLDAVWRSLFVKDNATSYGIFLMFAFTWVMAGIIGLGERLPSQINRSALTYDILLFAILSFTAVLWFVMLQTRMITTPGDLTQSFIGLLTLYYVALLIVVAALTITLWVDVSPRPILAFRTLVSAIAVPVALIIALVGIYATNYNGIQADILYKAGNNYDSAGNWDQSINAYKRALELQPSQDFYALFLGRAYLESARGAADPTKRASLIDQSNKTLLLAQQLNPLNTDHSANLARLYRITATMTDNPAERMARYQKSSDYYAQTIRLSPNTAHLHNEWSLTYLGMNDLAKAKEQLDISAELDPKFPQTFLYLGDYYRTQNDLPNAVASYLKAVDLDPNALSDPDGNLAPGPASVLSQPAYLSQTVQTFKRIAAKNPTLVSVHYQLADLYKRNGQLDLAQQELEQAAKVAPTDFMPYLLLTNFFSENGKVDQAVNAMKKALSLVPNNRSDYARFQDFNNQLLALQKDYQAVQKSPNDIEAHRTLANRWKGRGQPQFALPEYQAIARLSEKDYDAQKNIVLLNLQLGKIDDAQRTLATAAALAPDGEKPMWQNVQAAINAQKAGQIDQAVKSVQAALTQATDADKAALQAYLASLQNNPVAKN